MQGRTCTVTMLISEYFIPLLAYDLKKGITYSATCSALINHPAGRCSPLQPPLPTHLFCLLIPPTQTPGAGGRGGGGFATVCHSGFTAAAPNLLAVLPATAKCSTRSTMQPEKPCMVCMTPAATNFLMLLHCMVSLPTLTRPDW